MSPRVVSVCVVALILVGRLDAVPLTSAIVMETKNDVRYQPAAAAERPAQLKDTVSGNDVVRTGERSLVELQFNDRSLTRLGSKSVFSFRSEAREYRLEQGAALICIPKGCGGRRVVTAAITAAIEGTTLLVLGTGKIIFLEGAGKVTTNDGQQTRPIAGGEMAFLDNAVLKVVPVRLDPLLDSRLVRGRKTPLPTWPWIRKVARAQRGQPNIVVQDPAFREEGMTGLVRQRGTGQGFDGGQP